MAVLLSNGTKKVSGNQCCEGTEKQRSSYVLPFCIVLGESRIFP